MVQLNNYFLASALLVALTLSVGYQQVAGASVPAGLSTPELEFNKPPRTDPELDIETLRHEALSRVAKPDVSLSANAAGNERHLIRRRRSPISGGVSQLAQYSNGNQQLLIEDEQTMRRLLPDLIAQARHDKALERALIKMLIDTSLRSSLVNVANPQTGNIYNGRAIDVGEGGLNGFQPQYSSPLEQVLDEFSGAPDGVANSQEATGISLQPDRLTSLDKREYMKPCSFNAISCAKNPFRKLLLKN